MYNKELVPYYQLFDNSPLATAVLQADTFKVEMANQRVLEFWGRGAEVIGSNLLDVLPEIADQPYPAYLKQVCRTGKPIEETTAQVQLMRNGKLQSVFMDYSYTPIFGVHKQVTAVLVMATDICQQEINKLIATQNMRDLRTMVLSAPIAMCIYRGPEFIIELVNDRMLDLWQGTQRMHLRVLSHVFSHGVPYTMEQDGIRYTYTPLGAGISCIAGVCVYASPR